LDPRDLDVDKKYVADRAAAAKWMLDRKTTSTWWRWQVLTATNPDPETLRLQDASAQHIFIDLTARRLLLPVVAADGQLAYALNLGAEDWSEIASPPGIIRRAKRLLWKNLGLLVVTVLVAAMTAVVTLVVEEGLRQWLAQVFSSK
jgi:hypothetical protein